jgi:phage shock protein A
MGILTRIVRICKADIHGVMDHIEDQGLLLKQHLRDMEKALSEKEAGLKNMMASRRLAQQEYDKYTRESEKMEQDLTAAIEKERDDLARMLIRKLKPLAGHKDEISRHIQVLDQDIAHLKDFVEKQRLQYDQVQLQSKEFFHKTEQQTWDKNLSTIIPKNHSQDLSPEEVEIELLQRKEAIKGGEIHEEHKTTD